MSCGRAELRGRFDVRVTVRSATVSTYQRHNFFNRPDVIGDPGFHCWRHARMADVAESVDRVTTKEQMSCVHCATR